MAVIFPVTNTLFLPGEVATYWIEHVLLLGIPIWCLKFTDLTVPSKTNWIDYFGWGLMAYGVWGLFHFIVLQPLATLTLANLNSMLCPAITDPFRGPNYRSYGIVHQFFITLVFGCVTNLLGHDDKIMLDWKWYCQKFTHSKLLLSENKGVLLLNKFSPALKVISVILITSQALPILI